MHFSREAAKNAKNMKRAHPQFAANAFLTRSREERKKV
jgi:hypothetical protein